MRMSRIAAYGGAALLAGQTLVCAQNFNIAGYATVNADGVAATTGGAGGATKTISTLQALVDWAAAREKNTTPEIVQVSGKITGSGDNTLVTIKNGGNITIQGFGTTGELRGIGLNIRDYNNVIVRNLKIHEVLYPDDALTLDSVVHGWVDRCELHSKIGPGVTVDTYDGLLDIKNGSRWITISWCYLHDHMKCSLIGHTDNINQQATDSKIRVTYHHNYFVNTDGRNPSLRYGAAHMFNNYYGNITDYGLAARNGGHAKVENCHFENVKLPMSTDKFLDASSSNGDKIGGYICQAGNLFTDSCGANVISQTGCDFWTSATLPYTYTLDNVNTVKATVQQNAGRGNNPTVGSRDAKGAVSSARAVSYKSAYRVVLLEGLPGRASAKVFDAYDLNGKKVSSTVLSRSANVQKMYIVKQAPAFTVR